jgi:hypothetical protein
MTERMDCPPALDRKSRSVDRLVWLLTETARQRPARILNGLFNCKFVLVILGIQN